MPLPKPTSQHARQALRKAYQAIGNIISPADSHGFSNISLDDVRKACENIENELAARGLLRNMRRLMPLFTGLQHFSKSIGVLCNGTPFLPWVWAPITAILKIASDYVQALEVLIRVYAQIGESLGRFERLGRVFPEDHGLQEVISVFYCDILEFHKLAYKSVRRSSWKVLFTTTWGRFERRFGGIIEDMKRHGDLIDKEAMSLHIAETQTSLRNLDSLRQESLKRIEKEEKEASGKQYLALVSTLQLNESDQVAIFESLLHADRYDGTCSWTLTQPQIRSWLGTDDRPRSLWLQGKAGSGKSVLSAHLINYQACRGRPVVYHFCADEYASSKSYEQILRSLIRQLIQRDDEATGHAYKTFVLDRRPAKTAELERLLQDLFTILSDGSSEKGPIWVVLDGVDECNMGKIPRLGSFLRSIAAKSSLGGSPVCKVLCTSRPSQSLEKDFGKSTIVSLTKEHSSVQNAISAYVLQRLRAPQAYRRLDQLDVGDDELEHLRAQVTEKSDGMFLYARLILDFLTTQLFQTKDELLASVSSLPRKLEEYYARLLKQIHHHLDATSSDRLRCMLCWIAFAKRPLRRLEFLSAVTFTDGNVDVGRLVPSYFLEDCATLVEERHDSTLGFIHPSVKQFLMSDASDLRITEQEALHEQAIATISCLIATSKGLSEPSRDQHRELRVVKGLYGLAVYSSAYWWDYILSLAEQSQGRLDSYPHLWALASRLIQELDSRFDAIDDSLPHGEFPSKFEIRLNCLQSYPALRRHVETYLLCRSEKWLERSFVDTEDGVALGSPTKNPPDGTSKVLEAYQDCLRWLLSQDYYIGVSVEDFKYFKVQFGSAANTCRLRSCPCAANGFASEQLLREHELAHSRRPRCAEPGCLYPPFASSEALRRHGRKHHSPAATIKRKALPTVQQPVSGQRGMSRVGTAVRGTVAPKRTYRWSAKLIPEHERPVVVAIDRDVQNRPDLQLASAAELHIQRDQPNDQMQTRYLSSRSPSPPSFAPFEHSPSPEPLSGGISPQQMAPNLSGGSDLMARIAMPEEQYARMIMAQETSDTLERSTLSSESDLDYLIDSSEWRHQFLTDDDTF